MEKLRIIMIKEIFFESFMINKFLKHKILMIFLTLLIIYTIAVIADYLLHLKQYSKVREAGEIITLRQQTEDRKLIAMAKKENYVRIIFPYLYHKIEEIEKKFIKDITPVNGQPKTNVYDCNEGYGLIKYKTDRFGLRNEDEVWDQLNFTNKEKILFIGDSFVQGACVQKQHVISNNLKDFHNINLGSSGNDPYTYASLSELFIPVVKPKYVVLIFYANDNSPDGKIFLRNLKIKNIHERYFKNNNSSIELSDELAEIINNVEKYILSVSKNHIPGARPNTFKRAIRYLSLPTFRKTLSGIFQQTFFSIPESTKLSIDTLNKQCKIYSCLPIYGFIPNSNFWEPSILAEKYKKSIRDYLKEKRNNFIDFTEVLSKMGESEAFAQKGTHLSPKGYKAVSNEIAKFISNIKNN